MGDKSAIEWTDATWNPVTGCTKVSPGCKHCYAEVMARRLLAMGQARYANGFDLTLQPDVIDLPLRWKKPRTIFVNSMSDLFHRDIPTDYIRRCFDTMVAAKQHTFQVLTKRSERLAEIAPHLPWPSNVWMGVSVESAKYVDRIDALRTVPAAVRFLSVEPLLGPIPDLPLDGIHWVIVGGESGHDARPMHPDWARSIRDDCAEAGVPFFFKQWGEWGPTGPLSALQKVICAEGHVCNLTHEECAAHDRIGHFNCHPSVAYRAGKHAAGRVLDGRTWDEFPVEVPRA